jgi:hypothetical protein
MSVNDLTKGAIRSRKSMKDRQHNGQDTKGAIRSRKSMKDRQHNGQKIPKVQSEAVNQ